ncbi:hypothetical protein HPB51_021349 [Rhipicephalus microplus]|uniref:Uncharacterized protein n=1 Tax=Rhipicephalus microplus TaxID=6941 RepID=A0A9J6F7J5_RHIMP|nr:hypothetical protein HPB51_021349 [Rhipicephalus microplus]
MATRQRRSNTTGQGRRRHQCQQARQQQRADYQAQPTNGQEDEGNQRGIRDEVPVGVMAGPFMGPFVAQPLYYIPSTTQVYQPVIFQQEPILPVGQGDGASATQEYIRLMEGALRWSQHRSQRRGQRPLWGTGEPHEGSRDNPTPHAVGTEEDELAQLDSASDAIDNLLFALLPHPGRPWRGVVDLVTSSAMDSCDVI